MKRFLDWVNGPIWRRGRLALRRIDLVLAAGFVVCVAWYGAEHGLIGAVQGAVGYGLVVIVSLWATGSLRGAR